MGQITDLNTDHFNKEWSYINDHRLYLKDSIKYLTHISMAKIKTGTVKYWRECQWIIHKLLVGMQNGTAILGTI